MNGLQTFNDGNVDLKVKEANGVVYLDAEQAAVGLGITQVKNGKVYVRWGTVSKYLSQEVGKGDFITEAQFYKLAFKANSKAAERFTDWVAEDVLPAIRKHGAYMTDEKAFEVVNNPTGLANLLKQAADQLNAKDKEIETLKPKADKYDRYLGYKGLITITEIAKEYGMSGRELNQFLHEKGIIFKKGSQWFVYQNMQSWD